jgi:hypothetical protein
MKTFTYVAAIALLTAGTACAQSSGAVNGSTMNNSTPTPSATGPADSAGTSSAMPSPRAGTSQSSNMNQSDSMGLGKSSSSMNQSSDMDQSDSNVSKSASRANTHHLARNGGADARENQETRELNRRQLAGNSASMAPSGSMGGSGDMSGMSSSGAGNPFNSSSPQQAQAGGPNCTPDNPSCGTARQNPAINSAPQHRTYGAQQQ